MPHDHVFRDPLGVVEGPLLLRGQPDMAVQGRLEAPIDAEEFQLLPVVLDRRIEEVEVENRTDDVPFDPRVLQVLLRDDALFQQGL